MLVKGAQDMDKLLHPCKTVGCNSYSRSNFNRGSTKTSLTSLKLGIGSNYRKTFNISRTFVGSKIVDNSDVVGASPFGAAPTTSSLST